LFNAFGGFHELFLVLYVTRNIIIMYAYTIVVKRAVVIFGQRSYAEVTGLAPSVGKHNRTNGRTLGYSDNDTPPTPRA